VSVMCRVLGVSRSGYYAWCAEPGAWQERDRILSAQAVSVYTDSHGIYGYRKVHRALRDAGIEAGKHRVYRLLGSLGCRAVHRPRRKHVAERPQPRPNLLKRQFATPPAATTWVSDITQIALSGGGWLYLATVMTLPGRRIVGTAMARHQREGLVIKALERAWKAEGKPSEGLFHSDQGSQYGSQRVRHWLARHGFAQSMSGRGQCWDNACAESWFSLLKREWLVPAGMKSAQATRALVKYYLQFYNGRRMHSALDYMTPNDYALTA